MAIRDYYANTTDKGFTLSFFHEAAVDAQLGLLAAPFFNTLKPIEALTDSGCEVRLIVRFSPITTPEALRKALENPLVKVRYFTDAKFHTKLYIVDDVALVGSANLTNSGLEANRELSVLLRHDRDQAFNELPAIFDDLWNDADVLNEEVLREYTKAFKAQDKAIGEEQFERHVQKFIKPSAPKSVVVGSEKATKERTFIQNFHRKYDEILVPAHNEILEVAQANGFGRPEYEGHDPKIEMGRFLGWLRMARGAGDGWRRTSLLAQPKDRVHRIAENVAIWQSTDDTVLRDMYDAASEIENIANIQSYLSDPVELESLSFDQLFDYLAGCHAFYDRLRFASKALGADLSGFERLRIDFQRNNSREAVVKAVGHLLSGPGAAIERAYDCVYGKYKLKGFGEACVMELLGWGDSTRPPFNNRSIRGIRLLGFDVERLVAGVKN